jgi:hypothetical protein
MKTNRVFAWALLAAWWVAAGDLAVAVPIVFNLRDTGATFEIESGTITRGGITATLSSSVVGNAGLLNQTTAGFGVDVPGNGSDVPNHLDGGAGTESISIAFNVDVLWSQLVLSVFSSGEQALLTLGSHSAITLLDTGAGTDIFDYSANNLVLAGQTVVFRHANGNGFSFDSFTVEESITAVPDAGSSVALLGVALGCLGVLARCRRP